MDNSFLDLLGLATFGKEERPELPAPRYWLQSRKEKAFGVLQRLAYELPFAAIVGLLWPLRYSDDYRSGYETVALVTLIALFPICYMLLAFGRAVVAHYLVVTLLILLLTIAFPVLVPALPAR